MCFKVYDEDVGVKGLVMPIENVMDVEFVDDIGLYLESRWWTY